MNLSNTISIIWTTDASLLMSFGLAFILVLLVIPLIIKWSKRKSILDQPDHRKLHTIPIPTLGGLAIAFGFLMNFIFWYDGMQSITLFVAIVLLVCTGVVDDIKGLSSARKYLLQLIASIIVVTGGVQIESFYGFLGINELPVVVSYMLTIFLISGLVNAFNLIDGIDGLAGGLAFINAIVFVLFFVVLEDWYGAILAASLGGGLLAFLRYNFNPASIFMGDTGSMVIGFMMAVLGVRLINTIPDVSSPFNSHDLMLVAFGVLLLPAYDTIRVFIVRLSKKQSPFKPDQKHIHHLLIQTGSNHRQSALILYVSNLVVIGSALLLRNYSLSVSIPLLLIEVVVFTELITLKMLLKSIKRIGAVADITTKMGKQNRFLIENLK